MIRANRKVYKFFRCVLFMKGRLLSEYTDLSDAQVFELLKDEKQSAREGRSIYPDRSGNFSGPDNFKDCVTVAGQKYAVAKGTCARQLQDSIHSKLITDRNLVGIILKKAGDQPIPTPNIRPGIY